MGEKDESKLIKEFKESDVNRIRNIVTKKYNDKTSIQLGYRKAEVDHTEGDIWEENGKEWTIIDGLKQSYTKLDLIKKEMMMPFLCPSCGKPMKNSYDKKMYPLHHKCYSCVISMETLMRMKGTYADYAKAIVTGNMKGYLKDAKEFIVDFVTESDDTYTEQGDKQEFAGGFDRKKLGDKWLHEISEFEKNIENK